LEEISFKRTSAPQKFYEVRNAVRMSGSIIIVRHGRTEFNATGRLQGRTDNPLDEVGLAQAEAVATYLAPELLSDTLIVCSPLLRARQTATVIAEGVGTSLEIDERWIELDYGAYEGLRQSEVPSNVWREWRSDSNFAAPQGESLNQVQQRVADACTELAQRLDGRTAVVVSHVSPIKSAVAWALGVDVSVGWKTQLVTASITRLAISANGAALTSFNEVAR
jgi:probable phosphoglycerate mutase